MSIGLLVWVLVTLAVAAVAVLSILWARTAESTPPHRSKIVYTPRGQIKQYSRDGVHWTSGEKLKRSGHYIHEA